MAYIKKELDARRLLCPLPVIRAQDAVATMQAGERLRVVATDPGVKNDIPAWCRINGHKVEAMEEQDDEIVITIEVEGLGTPPFTDS
ncbi:MAG: sulfurtransferase TusA family protein [Thiohalomonadales bacterium]|jgi:TusA-related sulfurtransferase|nr:sulfurtransferase TusA family protein [Thiohalomonadales bacterium]